MGRERGEEKCPAVAALPVPIPTAGKKTNGPKALERAYSFDKIRRKR
jgi:hypothetical protein